MTIQVLLRDHPHRAIALATDEHILTFRHSQSTAGVSSLSVNSNQSASLQPRCMVEFSTRKDADLEDFHSSTSLSILGTLGLVTINGDIFLCVVNGATRVATIRPGENVQKIISVEFHCINKSDYDYLLLDRINPYSTDNLDEDGYDQRHGHEPTLEHPCLALKKLLSGGSFYYSADFDLTRRLQDRSTESATVALDSLDAGFLWNAYMIQPLVNFRSRLAEHERAALDTSRILTSAIRGFAMTITVPASSSPVSHSNSGLPSTLTLLSRLSSRRAGTRFNARGIDDDGNVANFVETETVFCSPGGMCFSYVQTRGSVPVFWEQAAGFTPGQQKVQITRSAEATQPAFDKHMSEMEINYGGIHVVNLLSTEKTAELELTRRYQYHVHHSPLNQVSEEEKIETDHDHEMLKETNYDFHMETRQLGYEAASGIKRFLRDSSESFAYYLLEEVEDDPKSANGNKRASLRRPMSILQQEGVFRTNCLDCLDRTNLVQTIISQMAIEDFLNHRGERRTTSDFWVRHGTLWADNGDALSKIYAGTGALKSSFTRSGKMSFAGALADVRKSATRLYINNFEDKGRQNTIDLLLGRLMGQLPVHLYDPINDWVSAEMIKRTDEYSSSDTIHIHVGTFNLNGKTQGISEDLSSWLCPPVDPSQEQPEIVAVGFQEIVELSPQQIMSTDPHRRQAWEEAVKRTLNVNAQKLGSEEYVLLRGGQLVGASLSVFVKASILPHIKNVEGSLKKTGMSGMAGNKGAVAIRMDYANTSICLVTAHLAAGFANYEERNQDYRTINHGLRFQRNRSIEDHDTVIWLGDFNYRIGMSNDRTRHLIKDGDLETLYANDQLNLQMVHGKTFPFYTEAMITFLPTYKYDNGTDEYDTSDKARIPAWCDRVLSKGHNLRQIHYDTAPLMFSDHRPVFGTFQCTITAIDEKTKDAISEQLYNKRRAVVGDDTANTRAADTDEEDLMGYESVQAGFPPASSDKRKWWLDGGLPARSRVKPPGNEYTRNPDQPPNPFTPTQEADWVKVDKPSPPAPRSFPVRQTQTSQPQPLRKLPPAWPTSSNDPSSSSPRGSYEGTHEAHRSRNVSTSSTATTSSPPTQVLRQTLRKPAPPIPKKPNLLRSESGTSTSTSTANEPPPPTLPSRQRINAPSAVAAANNVPFPPPPRRSTLSAQMQAQTQTQTMQDRRSSVASVRSMAESSSRGGSAAAPSPPASRGVLRKTAPPPGSMVERTPALPPRSGSGSTNASASLMDEEDGEMKGWKPLRPQ